MDKSPDGWVWTDLHADERVASDSILALTVEALRRGIDLRDAAAASGEEFGLTQRALHLMAVINLQYERAVLERADSLDLSVQVPHGAGHEIVQDLMKLGILTPTEYQPN